MRLSHIPNLITLLRFCSVPLTVWLIGQDWLDVAFWVFIAAALTDALDGALARALNARSELGEYLDPLADKALLVAAYVTLAINGHLPSWLVILVVFRDVLIVGAVLLFNVLFGSITIHPLFISKVNTVVQIVLAAVVMGGPALNLDVSLLVVMMVWVVVATTVLSGFAYLREWVRQAALVRNGARNGG